MQSMAESCLLAPRTIYVTNGAHGHVPLFQLWVQNSGKQTMKLVFRDTDGITAKNGPSASILEMVKISTRLSTRWGAFKIGLVVIFS